MVVIPPDIEEGPLKQRLGIYCNMMHEIFWRLKSIEVWKDPQATKGIHEWILSEYLHLQPRMCCEVVALAVLLAHGDIKQTQTNKFQKAAYANWIVKALGKIHPMFYPQPFRPIYVKETNTLHAVPIEEGFLTQKELPQLYALCGNVVHRGTLKNIVNNEPRITSIREAEKWLRKFPLLLSNHKIVLKDSREEYWFSMRPSPDNESVDPRITIMTNEPPPWWPKS